MNYTYTVAGVHCYAGGFILGCEKGGMTVVGSHETWPAAFEFREQLGIKLLPFKLEEKVDVVVANPPCSRFSSSSFNKFSCDDRSALSNFADLQYALDFGIKNATKVIWWENGPLAWGKNGVEIIKTAHDYVEKYAACKVTTLVLKVDTYACGLTQSRPRTHVIHLLGDYLVAGIPLPILPEYSTVHEFLEHAHAYDFPPTQVFGKPFVIDDPVSQFYSAKEYGNGGWSRRPQMSRMNAKASHSIWSRLLLWEEPNRWLYINEAAALMGLPTEGVDYAKLYDGNVIKTMMVMGKGVATYASSFLAERLIIPALNERRVDGGGIVQNQTHDHIFYGRIMATGRATK